jgi:hypothetical protein
MHMEWESKTRRCVHAYANVLTGAHMHVHAHVRMFILHLLQEDLVEEARVGSGACSYVQRARHTPTGCDIEIIGSYRRNCTNACTDELVALKVFNCWDP